ncbi:MAG: exonuclease SbcCD subunit D [Finegoldia sp.]|nr:exonuclease SbcCD subunit D [Finegoldia sp.]
MKLLHLSDLHLGKSLNNYSLIEDQKYCLDQILKIIEEENIDTVMIAGDIYDSSIPSADALEIYSDFVKEIIFKMNKTILAVSGNHDSAKRLDYNKAFYEANNYYMDGEYTGRVVTLEDAFGKIHFHLIPFISLAKARTLFDTPIKNFTDLYKNLLAEKTYEDRNVLISHCYANNHAYEDEAYNEDEKPLSMGGSDAMDVSLFYDFDYVALGHLHRRHKVSKDYIRYSGTFMKYSFSEVGQKKSVTIVDLTDHVEIYEREILPLHDLEILNDSFENIMKADPSDAYIQFILKDDCHIDNVMGKLKEKFPNAANVSYEFANKILDENDIDIDINKMDSYDLFQSFYKYKMDEEMKEDEKEILKKVIE